MRKFVVEVLDTAEQITPEKAFDILTFAFRGEVLSVQEAAEQPVAADGATESLEDSPWQTGERRGAAVIAVNRFAAKPYRWADCPGR